MRSRLAIAVMIAVSCGGFASSQPPTSSGEVDRRLAELEKRVEAMLQEVRAIRAESQARQTKAKTDEVRIFALKFAKASDLARTLKGLLQGPDAKDLALSVDERSNSLLAKGDAKHLEVIEAIVVRLDQEIPKTGKVEQEKKAATTEEELKARLKGLEFNLNLDAQQWRDRAEWLKRMGQKGFISPVQIEIDLKQLEQARDQLLKLRDQLKKQIEPSKKPEEPKKPAK